CRRLLSQSDPMHIESRDLWGRVSTIEVPAPIATPGAIVVRTAYSWKWPHGGGADRVRAARTFTTLVLCALRHPARAAWRAAERLVSSDSRRLRLALDHHVGAYARFARTRHTCFSISGRIHACGAGVRRDVWQPGMWVCGFGFKAPPDAACHLVSPQFLLAVPAGMDAAVASLVMPAAMLRFGLERAASTIAPASIVVSPSPISDFAELCAREWLSPRAEGPTLVVELSARVADAERSFASFEATHREVRGLWIQSAPSDPPPEPRLRSDAARLTIVPIPDPWSTWNLDVLSEDALESPPWATPERLERTLEWLRGHQ